ARQFIEQLAWIAAAARRHLGGDEACDQAVLVGGPYRAVAAQERGAGAFLAGKAEIAAEQAVDEPFEADRRLHQPAPEFFGDAIDDRAADHAFADRAVAPPARAMREQIRDRRGLKM